MLAFLGRYATLFMAGGVLTGIAVPPLAALAKPLLVPTLMIPLALALIRLDWGAIGLWARRPAVLVALLVWLLLASPVLVWAIATPLVALGFPAALREALILMAASSPIVSCVAIALAVGLEATLAIVAVLVATALVPLLLPPVALALAGTTIDLEWHELMLRLALLIGGAFLAAWLVRRFVPAATLAANASRLDGLAVINLVVFAVAIMDGVTELAFERPGYVATALISAYAFNLLLQVAGYTVFRRLGERPALTVGLVSGNCNMGLVLVALQGRASFDVIAFFAIAQIPMYTLPALLARFYRRRLDLPRGGARLTVK